MVENSLGRSAAQHTHTYKSITMNAYVNALRLNKATANLALDTSLQAALIHRILCVYAFTYNIGNVKTL